MNSNAFRLSFFLVSDELLFEDFQLQASNAINGGINAPVVDLRLHRPSSSGGQFCKANLGAEKALPSSHSLALACRTSNLVEPLPSPAVLCALPLPCTQGFPDSLYGLAASNLVAGNNLEGNEGDMHKCSRNTRRKLSFSCVHVRKGNHNAKRTPRGLIFRQRWNNRQFITNASFITTVYSDYLTFVGKSLNCAFSNVSPAELLSFAKSQVDYNFPVQL
ncbi:hypothetical protein ACS0TY_017459 [Phlomoides rotata]